MKLTERYADRLERAEDGSVTLTLRKPLKTTGGDIAFLALRRPTYDDLITQTKQAGDDMDKVGWMLARLSGVAANDFGTIDAGDGMILAEVVGEFLDRDPEDKSRSPGDLPERHAERIAWTDEGAMLALRSPLATKDGVVNEITLRRPTWNEAKANKAPGLAAVAKMVATLSGVGPLTIGQIDGLDGLILGEIVGGFLESFPTTGGA